MKSVLSIGGRAGGKGPPGGGGRRALAVLFVLTLPLVTPKIRGADEVEYFSYLRSLVFDHDLEFGNEYERFHAADPQGLAGFKATFLERRETETGRHINFAPLGCALLWSPFYLLAHAGVLAARAAGASVAADGFSLPYVAAVCYASALYGLAGLLLVHDALRRHGGFAEPAATLAVAGLWLGTPLLYYMTLAPAFSHAAGVFTVALLVWLSLRAARPESSPWTWAAVGAAGGLAALVREQDALFLIIPAGTLLVSTLARNVDRTQRGPAGAAPRSGGAQPFALAIKPGGRSGPPRPPTPLSWGAALVRGAAMGAAAFLVFLPQLFAYRALTGRFGPSRLVARKMSWSSPHLLQVLFDPGHGLFAWSPLLLVATAGLAYLVVHSRGMNPRSLFEAGGTLRSPQTPQRQTVALLAVALLLQVWINGAVESWTQAGAFGSRRFVSSTPILAWGLAALLAAVPPSRARLASLAVALFVGWNLGLMVQFGLKLMDRQRLEWPRVAVNQVTAVPRHLARAAWLFFTDRERLVREGP